MVQDPKTRTGYDESWLKVTLPHTYAYLKQFEAQLRRRSGYKKFFASDKDPFYAMYDIGEYTFAPLHVMWRQMIGPLHATVVEAWEDELLGTQTPVTQHVVTIVLSKQARKRTISVLWLIRRWQA